MAPQRDGDASVTGAAGPLSHRRRWEPSVVQATSPGRWTDLGPGYLGPELLPVDLLRSGYADALAIYGSAALHYGANRGVARLREILAGRAGDGSGDPDGIVITSGTSAALHLLAGRLADPGDSVLVEESGYDLGHQILVDRGLRLVPIPTDMDGPEPAGLIERSAVERRAGRRVAFAYLVPTFHNPTGRLVGKRRRAELVDAAQTAELPLVEDDAYRELPLDPVEIPASLTATACRHRAWRLGTFSKTLAPGLRLGWIDTDPRAAFGLGSSGLLDSGGGLNHLASLAALTLLDDGRYDQHLIWLRAQLRERRNALVAGLGELASFVQPKPSGGFFCWLDRMAPVGDPVRAAEDIAVRVAAGRRFGGAMPTGSVRLSYSQHGPQQLNAAARRLAEVWLPLARPEEISLERCDHRSMP